MNKQTLVSMLMATSAVLGVSGAVAPLPGNPKSVIYFGWDTLGAKTEDVYRDRTKFAETGFDGICMPLTGKTEGGKVVDGKYPIRKDRFTREMFADSIVKIKEMMKFKGLSGSYLQVYWMSTPRLKWDDDAAWETFAANMRFLAEIAKETGLKGLFIDHEDYTGKPLFRWRQGEDPSFRDTLKLARRRGHQIVGATAAGFPEGRIINDRLLTQWQECLFRQQQPAEAYCLQRQDLWAAFVNGGLEAKPDGFGFEDGCEAGYYVSQIADYELLKYRAKIEARALLEEGLRAKHLATTKVCFGKYFDYWFMEKWQGKPRPPFSSGVFAESFFNAGAVCDDVYWVYGEKNSIIRWGRKVRSNVDCETSWNDRIPDLATILRVSVGDYSQLRELADGGLLTNLISNAGCASPDGKWPKPFGTYVDKKNEREGLFAWDGAVGCAAPGALCLSGVGNVCVSGQGLRPYDRLFVRFAAKGRTPNVNIVWRAKGRGYLWDLDTLFLGRPCRVDENGWKHYEAVLTVPLRLPPANDDGTPGAESVAPIDSVGLIFGGMASQDAPVWFDDISIYKW